uniref:Uncharacterized protein n=1 Tax=Anguilla anguilla TaxID=7936 RepID=A0A0E9QA16_ANGAN
MLGCWFPSESWSLKALNSTGELLLALEIKHKSTETSRKDKISLHASECCYVSQL